MNVNFKNIIMTTRGFKQECTGKTSVLKWVKRAGNKMTEILPNGTKTVYKYDESYHLGSELRSVTNYLPSGNTWKKIYHYDSTVEIKRNGKSIVKKDRGIDYLLKKYARVKRQRENAYKTKELTLDSGKKLSVVYDENDRLIRYARVGNRENVKAVIDRPYGGAMQFGVYKDHGNGTYTGVTHQKRLGVLERFIIKVSKGSEPEVKFAYDGLNKVTKQKQHLLDKSYSGNQTIDVLNFKMTVNQMAKYLKELFKR